MKLIKWYINRNKKRYTSWHITIWYTFGASIVIADYLWQYILILIIHLIAVELANKEAFEQYRFTHKQLKQLIKST